VSGLFEHLVLEATELRPFHSNETGRDYLLYVSYPDSYASSPNRRFPVVYVTDAYWNFVKTQALGPSLWFDKIVPEYIVVGIGYQGKDVDYNSERMYELSPTPQTYGYMSGFKGRQGGARLFLNALKNEIIPYVENNLRADASFRTLAGFSMGGLFGLFAMYEEPGLFQGVIASSPSMEWDHMYLFRRADEYRAAALGDDYRGENRLPVRLFMSVGECEWPHLTGAVKSFDEYLRSASYTDFSYQFSVIEGSRHSGSTIEAYSKGLRFVFQPRMPSKHVS
jgi:uncharacterized protein